VCLGIRAGSRLEATVFGHQPVTVGFAQDPDSDASVLFGAVAADVESVVVGVLGSDIVRRPDVAAWKGFGGFFVITFEEPVAMAWALAEAAGGSDTFVTGAGDTAPRARRRGAESDDDADGAGGIGVREPRRPAPSAGSASAAIEPPDPFTEAA
jgi:hypothetical protein